MNHQTFEQWWASFDEDPKIYSADNYQSCRNTWIQAQGSLLYEIQELKEEIRLLHLELREAQ